MKNISSDFYHINSLVEKKSSDREADTLKKACPETPQVLCVAGKPLLKIV